LKEELKITAGVSLKKGRILKDGIEVFNAGQVSAETFLSAAYKYTGQAYPKFHKMDGLSKLGWLAAEYLISKRNLSTELGASNIGIVLANRNSSLDADQKYYQSVTTIPSPALFVYTLPNIVMGEICIRHHFKGENAFFIQERFNEAFIKQYAGGLLNNNILQACICGWIDLLGEEYEAVLMLVEKADKGKDFSELNMLTYFE
jgi:hypothetical protein